MNNSKIIMKYQSCSVISLPTLLLYGLSIDFLVILLFEV